MRSPNTEHKPAPYRTAKFKQCIYSFYLYLHKRVHRIVNKMHIQVFCSASKRFYCARHESTALKCICKYRNLLADLPLICVQLSAFRPIDCWHRQLAKELILLGSVILREILSVELRKWRSIIFGSKKFSAMHKRWHLNAYLFVRRSYVSTKKRKWPIITIW